MKTLLVMPCLDEEAALPRVLADLPLDAPWLRVVVVDNGSRDQSAEVARSFGVEVVREERRGYGAACLRGIAERRDEEIVAFLDCDHADDPRMLPVLLAPIREGRADLVLGSRMLRPQARRALPLQARFGNRLAAYLLRRWFGLACTDLGPFRAIRADALARLDMQDRDYGWTVEMQAKAGLAGLRSVEIAVPYRPRIGRSKITGTLRGTLLASYKILKTLWILRRGRHRRGPTPPEPPVRAGGAARGREG